MLERDGKNLIPVSEVVSQLRTGLGDRLTALIAGVKDVSAVHKWEEGKRAPLKRNAGHLRLAYQVTQQMLAASEAPETVRAWFTGMDPLLEDRAPALVIAESKLGDRDTVTRVIRAAKAFLAE